MSTKSSALYPAPKGPGLHENLCPELCTARWFPAAQGNVTLKDQPGSSLFLSVRPLNIATDLPAIHSWMTRQFSLATPAGLSLALLDEAWSSILASDFAQPFIGLINNIPVCQIDVYKTRLDAISLCYESRPGDYGLHILYDARTDPNNFAALLRACTAYFLSFPEVGRIITDVETNNKSMKQLIRSLGFRWHRKINMPYKLANLYIASRRTFVPVSC